MPVLLPHYPHSRPLVGAMLEGTGFSDGSVFSDSTKFASFDTRASVAEAANAGEVFVSISKDHCGTIQSGHVFSVDGRLYEIRFVEEQTETLAKVEIQPELRVSLATGDVVNFDTPSVFARIVDPTAFSRAMTGLFSGDFSIDFIEDTSPVIGA